jgi:hypothetical protein
MITSFPSDAAQLTHGHHDWRKSSGLDAAFAPGLLSAADLLIEIWPNPNSRPSLRWLREQTARRMLPYIKMGHKVFFNPIKVRQALEKNFSVHCY